ncbi:MAG: excalibur calcium-binding domain-containing protein [Sphingomicrobium sp.]
MMSAKDILITVGLVGTAAAVALDSNPRTVTIGGEPQHPTEQAAASNAVERSVTYAGCDEVRRIGKAPLYAGQPGYRIGMDGDGDGIACEPRRAR